MMKKGPMLALGAIFVGVILLVQVRPGYSAPTVTPNWPGTPPGVLLSTGAVNGAIDPWVAYSPDGSTLAVVYLHDVGAIHTPYVRISTDDGTTWNGPTRIVANSTVDATTLNLTVDANNKVHVVWLEQNEVAQTTTLRYANNSSGSWVAQTLSEVNYSFNAPGMTAPRIRASGSNVLDVVWSQNFPHPQNNNLNVVHMRSITGGSSWGGVNPVAITSEYSLNPVFAQTTNGKLHVVWEELVLDPPLTYSRIRYAEGTVSGTGSSWIFNPVSPINLAEGDSDFGVRPAIAALGNMLYVVYTNRDGGDNNQPVFLTTCDASCSNFANWHSSPDNPISGAPVGANTQDPYYVIPAIVSSGACVHVYYHGTDGITGHTTEVIWGVSSCNSWNQFVDRGSEFEARSMYPRLASDGEWLQLVYELRVSGQPIQIYHRQRVPPAFGIFLPVTKK
ncbi:MAG: hypothetical protein V9G20_06890 [Candidatus Promineifilaceae bacterium]|nr:hypothetical protein [Chloroflexota bacterium]